MVILWNLPTCLLTGMVKLSDDLHKVTYKQFKKISLTDLLDTLLHILEMGDFTLVVHDQIQYHSHSKSNKK